MKCGEIHKYCIVFFLPEFMIWAKPANGLRYLRWGGGRRSRPTRKMIRRVKLLEMCAESPASGARFVGWLFGL